MSDYWDDVMRADYAEYMAEQSGKASGKKTKSSKTDTRKTKKRKVRYARVPSGAETCAFCIMLASRDFIYASEQTASHAHANCDCRIVPGFTGETKVEGYDPDALYDQYLEARKVVEAMFTKADWEFVPGALRTKLILQEMRRQLREQKETVGRGASVEIDEFTPCLRRIIDNQIVTTTFEAVRPTKADVAQWELDWVAQARSGNPVLALKATGDTRVQGLISMKEDPSNSAIFVDLVEAAPFNSGHNDSQPGKEYSGVGPHLFAEAVKKSYELGYNGFVIFDAKTDLIRHYEQTLGAVRIGRTQRMYINEEGAKRLYEQYYGKPA